MAAKIEFYIDDSDFDRLYAIKTLQGLDDLTGNEFAERLLHSKLYSLFPAIPEYDEAGQLLNADKYRGERA